MSDADPTRPFLGLDPEQAADLVRQVQDLGFDAARSVVGRFSGLFEGFRAGRLPGPEAEGPVGRSSGPDVRLGAADETFRRLQSEAQKALDAYLGVLGRLSDLARPLSGAAAPPRETLAIPDVAPGGRASSRLWLHNTSSSTVSGLRPWAPPLTAHSGDHLPEGAVSFAPERIERLDPEGSRRVVVLVEAPATAAVGTYHGLVLVEGLPETTIALTVDVIARPAAP